MDQYVSVILSLRFFFLDLLIVLFLPVGICACYAHNSEFFSFPFLGTWELIHSMITNAITAFQSF